MSLRVHVAPLSRITVAVLAASLLGLSAGCSSTVDGPAQAWNVGRFGASHGSLEGFSEA